MGAKTGIAWTDSTFNAWRGCVEVSPGCAHCYAATLSKRNHTLLGTWGTESNGGERVVASESMWLQPLKWDANRKVFCNSLADVFEDWSGPMLNHKGDRLAVNTTTGKLYASPDGLMSGGYRWITMADVRVRLFDLWRQTALTWQVVTKRPENIKRLWPGFTGNRRTKLDNVWLGTTVENQAMADRRIPELLKARDLSPVLFLSIEPMLGMVEMLRWLQGIDWVIVGCESGGDRRAMSTDWARDVRDQCAEAGVPLFVKQLEIAGKVTSDVRLFPEDLQIQEFPS